MAYVPLPKAACTTIKHVFSQIDPHFDTKAAALAFEGTELLHHVYRTKRFNANDWQRYATGWHRFCIIRDPLARVLSCYTNRVVAHRDLHKSPRLRTQKPDLPMDPDPDFFFAHIGDYASNASVIRHHVLPVDRFLGIRHAQYDQVYRIEELDACITFLEARAYRKVTREVRNSSTTKLSIDDLSGATKKHLSAFLAQEYRDLAPWYDNPFL
ncbi:sulfotransferase family 2 domain-containing protein [Sulfitobacter aestuariivivens]|uniref:sulfotransferase family 2 domain-containing protein n=1 Tax=Sulfitobacter aestuariivivens TaxID=2766981 RepID=UPI002483A1FE|nr:sulfotransferase family 2 domain-containing protein [Sulfitobacter aestuariivivens]